LHDVGHAPFSHAGEKFFLEVLSEDFNPAIYKTLVETVDDPDFESDFNYKEQDTIGAKEHEVMSAIIGIRLIKDRKNDPAVFDRSFFARWVHKGDGPFCAKSDNTERSVPFVHSRRTKETDGDIAYGSQRTQKGPSPLCYDDDILFCAKNICSNPITEEYFARSKRRKPLWKSEAEYTALIDRYIGDDAIKQMEDEVENVEKMLTEAFGFPLFNDRILQEWTKRWEDFEKGISSDLNPKDRKSLSIGHKLVLKWLNGMKEVAEQNGLPYDFAIITSNKFISGFLKEEIETIKIWFPQIEEYKNMNDVQPPLIAPRGRKGMFYIYYRHPDDTSYVNIDIKKMAQDFRKKLVE
jgi:hypothetical protein